MFFTALWYRVWFISQECSETSSLSGTAAWKKGIMHRVSPIWSLVQSNPTAFLVTKTFIFTAYTDFLFGAYTHLQTFPEQLYNTALGTWRNAARRRNPGWFGLGWGRGLDLVTCGWPGEAASLCASSLCLEPNVLVGGWRASQTNKTIPWKASSSLGRAGLLFCQISWLAWQTLQPDHCHIQGMISRSKGPRCHLFGDSCKRPSKV